MKRLLVLLTGASLALLAAACGPSPNVPYQAASQDVVASSGGPAAAVVTLANVSFGPSIVNIRAGQTVEWVWEDKPIPHNVTFAHFASPTQTTGTWFHTFDTPGVYRYGCTLHDTMAGVVIVR